MLFNHQTFFITGKGENFRAITVDGTCLSRSYFRGLQCYYHLFHTRTRMHSCASKYLRETAMPHLHTASNSNSCSTGIPGLGQVSSLRINSSTEGSTRGGGS